MYWTAATNRTEIGDAIKSHLTKRWSLRPRQRWLILFSLDGRVSMGMILVVVPSRGDTRLALRVAWRYSLPVSGEASPGNNK
jgi:hypothetical protein